VNAKHSTTSNPSQPVQLPACQRDCSSWEWEWEDLQERIRGIATTSQTLSTSSISLSTVSKSAKALLMMVKGELTRMLCSSSHCKDCMDMSAGNGCGDGMNAYKTVREPKRLRARTYPLPPLLSLLLLHHHRQKLWHLSVW
jgi:hypothetical protein